MCFAGFFVLLFWKLSPSVEDDHTLHSGTNSEAAHERTPSLLLYFASEVQALVVAISHRSDLLRLPVTAACSAGAYPKSLRMELATNQCVSH